MHALRRPRHGFVLSAIVLLSALWFIPGGIAQQQRIEQFTIRVASTASGVTASTTQTQGQGAITTNLVQVSTVANANDVQTLPPAAAGLEVTVINDGANTLQIFPTSGDDLGAGVDASTLLEVAGTMTFVAYDATNWQTEAGTGTQHAEMFDADNTDAFAIVDVGGDDTVYHTNGLAAGDLSGWTFDAGGAGISFPIASIADGVASGVDIEVTTTGSNGLAVGDIVSQSNLANAAYVGLFVVKAIISDTEYEVAAVFTATGTGTMDQAATLIAGVGSAGDYLVQWTASATAESNNDIFDFDIHVEAVEIISTTQRRKFGIAADIGSMSGVSIITVADGDHVAFVVANVTAGTGDITLRDFALVLVRL